ncbi:MAG: 4-amino-4-deoxychorismate lyase [Crocinitomicaceae bacterium]|nr:4-amino-4-deoxychorismate lyase [Crocinitomicaceae bacterium]|tara:strand:- start:3994 stop:4842 length:849 start_codon:yes stop_codon:yes gene_type:complete
MSRGSFVIDNGKITSTGNAFISQENRSFKYGDGLFETIRSIKTKLPFWDFHIQRLKHGLEILEIDASKIEWQKVKAEISELLEMNEHKKGAKVRMSFYRGGGGTYFPTSNEAQYSIESYELPNESFVLNNRGKQMDFYTRIKKPLNILSMVKSANAQLFVMAARYAQQSKLDDAFIINGNNELCEAVSSNVFVIRGDQVYTPPLSSGCLPGTMRMVLISLLTKKGIKVNETPISPSDLIMADEIFLTNAIDGISWVSGHKSKRFYKKYSEALVQELNKIFVA